MQPVGTVDHNLFPLVEAAQNLGTNIVAHDSDRHRPQRNAVIIAHHVNKGPLLARLDGHARNHDLVLQRIHQQLDIHKLAREQVFGFIGENRLELRGSRGRIDHVIQRQKIAGFQLLRIVPVPGFHRQLHACAAASSGRVAASPAES